MTMVFLVVCFDLMNLAINVVPTRTGPTNMLTTTEMKRARDALVRR